MTWNAKLRQLAWDKLVRIKTIVDGALAADRAAVDPETGKVLDPEKVLDAIVDVILEVIDTSRGRAGTTTT